MKPKHEYLNDALPKTENDLPLEDAPFPGHPDFGKSLQELYGEEGAKKYLEESRRRTENLKRLLKTKQSSESRK